MGNLPTRNANGLANFEQDDRPITFEDRPSRYSWRVACFLLSPRKSLSFGAWTVRLASKPRAQAEALRGFPAPMSFGELPAQSVRKYISVRRHVRGGVSEESSGRRRMHQGRCMLKEAYGRRHALGWEEKKHNECLKHDVEINKRRHLKINTAHHVEIDRPWHAEIRTSRQ